MQCVTISSLSCLHRISTCTSATTGKRSTALPTTAGSTALPTMAGSTALPATAGSTALPTTDKCDKYGYTSNDSPKDKSPCSAVSIIFIQEEGHVSTEDWYVTVESESVIERMAHSYLSGVVRNMLAGHASTSLYGIKLYLVRCLCSQLMCF